MANLNKIDVPIAVTHKTKLDLSCDHVTSMGFMTTQPVYYRHMIKGEHISINASSTVRPAPIEVPTFGQLNQNLRYFFVPYRLVFPNWDSFYNDVIASNVSDSSLVSSPPIISNSALQFLFTERDFGLSSESSDSSFDFICNGSRYYYTSTGRFVLKLLRSLGYEPIWSKGQDFVYNALGLLAYIKIYLDWYANSQYLNSVDVLTFERAIKFNDPTSFYNLTGNTLLSLMSLVGNVVYDVDDYFVNAWDNPVSPNSGQYTGFAFSDPSTNNGAYVVTNSLGSPEMVMSNQSSQVGTTYIHEALKKLTDFQKRHALAGARSIDRVLAQYGVITDSLKQQRSIYVGNQQTSIDIGSVYATAAGSNGPQNSSTGDYSGAGFGMRKDFNVDFTADEEGILICVASIIPTGTIVQGYDRNNLHLDKLDFFVPEFDSLGVQAIEKGEVYISNGETFADNDIDYRGVFGFSGRYAEYKRPKSFFTGDMSIVSAMQGGRSWTLNRFFNDVSFSADIRRLTHSLSFTRGSDADQYHRIFQYVNDDLDPFYCFMHFNVASFAPCKPLFETYEFDDDGKKVPTENGNKVN
ncbi:putative capsid protein [Cooperia oncophora]